MQLDVRQAAGAHRDGECAAAEITGAEGGGRRDMRRLDDRVLQRGLIRQRRSADGPLVAIGLVLLALVDIVGAALLDPVIEPQHVAAGAALCAGYLGGRALAIAVRTTRLPHVELHLA